MAEYIDREALLQDINEMVLFSVKGTAEPPTSEMRGANKVIDRVKASPAADVAEVKHGEWMYSAETINTMSGYFCSACKDPIWHSPDAPQAFRYCPNCGANMRGRTNGKK